MIRLKNLSYAYRRKMRPVDYLNTFTNLFGQADNKRAAPLFDSLNLQLASGQIYGLLGLNGAGKTTLLQLLCGLRFPKSGQLEVKYQSINVIFEYFDTILNTLLSNIFCCCLINLSRNSFSLLTVRLL